MKIYLMRHGEAEFFAKDDASRALTAEGSLHLEAKLLALKKQLSDVDLIVHSPYLRARQTAAIVAEALAVDSLREDGAWTPDSDPLEAISGLEIHSNHTVLVVTHMSLVADVEALLCHGSKQYPAAFCCGEISELTAEWPAVGLATAAKRYP